MNNLTIQTLPTDVVRWLSRESERRGQSQHELAVAVLREAARTDGNGNGNGKHPAETAAALAPPEAYRGPYGFEFSFIDLFAGIGGLRLGLERNGGHCRFSSEWDPYCQKTYEAWHGERPAGDINQIRPDDIPDHTVLAAGFPCQPFSLAGVSKKNSLGRAHGFRDATQGTLFFTLAEVIAAKRPPVVLLENVKNIRSHDRGRTWRTIRGRLEEDLGYRVFADVIDARHWVPQHRERVFIVAFDPAHFGDAPPFRFPEPPPGNRPRVRDILQPEAEVDERYVLSDQLWAYLQNYAEKHRAKGNGFGFGLADLDGVARTLSARYYKDGSEILIPRPSGNPRRLTPREAARLMGFPDHYRFPVSDTQAYRQLGNAVVPLVAEALCRQIVTTMVWAHAQRKNYCLFQ